MSKEAKPAAEAGEAAAPKKSKKLLIIIIAVLVLVLGGGGAAAYLLMQKNADHGDDEEEVVVEKSGKKKKGEKEAPPAYVAFDAFTVNLIPETGDQFLQLIISVEVSDISVGDRLKMYMPKLRNNITMILSTKKPSELVTKEGKEKLAEEIRTQINAIVEVPAVKGKPSQEAVKEVLFTSFIIQ